MKNFAENLYTSFSQFYKTSVLAMVDYSSTSSRLNTPSSSFTSNSSQFNNIKRSMKKSPYVPVVVVIVLVVLIGAFFISKAVKQHPTTNTLGASATNHQVSIAKPIAQQTLNKSFDFPLKDAAGKEVSKIHYEIQSAEMDNQVIVKGQVATAVQGKAFLILNLKITNSYDKAIQLNTRDYVRLIVNNASDKLAADIHNDPVDIQPISTKYTRIGFPIDANASNLQLQVGEIDGPKQTIQLNLQ